MCRHLCLDRTSCIADRAADHECMHERRACRLLVIHQPKYTPNASSIEVNVNVNAVHAYVRRLFLREVFTDKNL